jgi:hypothetical protein
VRRAEQAPPAAWRDQMVFERFVHACNDDSRAQGPAVNQCPNLPLSAMG